jgi:acyl dehydratase
VTGRTWDQVSPGDTFETPRRTITDADVAQFASLSGDHNPLHTDEAYARTTVFGRCIAHGVLVLAVTTGLAAEFGLFEGTALGLLEVSSTWGAPTFPGDVVRAILTVTDKAETTKPDRGLVSLQVRALNQAEVVVMVSTWKMLIRRSGRVATGG